MISLSSIYSPTLMRHREAFSARQYARQAFGNLIDPVINIDWFEMCGPTFPPHPHAGFSAVTYVFADSPNGFVNRDSLGTVQDILPGGLHWSRASRGMMHEETPIDGGGPARGLQIFVNLPAANQSDPEAAFSVPAAMVQLQQGDGWTSCTPVDGTTLGGAVNALPSPVRIVEVKLEAGASYDLAMPAAWGGIVIVLDGSATLSNRSMSATQAIGFASSEDDAVRVAAAADGARIVAVAGAQLHQPIYAHGPLMTATPAGLNEALERVSHLYL